VLRYRVWCLVCATLVCALPLTAASADDVLGAYVGAGIGQSQIDIDSLSFSAHDTGWKAVFGLRPISPFGAEVEYVDLGSPHGFGGFGRIDSTATGPAVFGLGYLPLPLPYLDLYLKAGLANIQQRATVSLGGGINACAAGITCAGFSRTESEFAWGGGAQIKAGAFAVRVEFEQYRASGGDLNFGSVGFFWMFL